MSQSAQEYKNLLTEVVKKQIIILGPNITLAKIKKVKGIAIDDTGTVTGISGQPQEITKQLIEEFRDLSEEIVRKTMKPIMLRKDQSSEETKSPTPEQTITKTEEAQEVKESENKNAV